MNFFSAPTAKKTPAVSSGSFQIPPKHDRFKTAPLFFESCREKLFAAPRSFGEGIWINFLEGLVLEPDDVHEVPSPGIF